MLKDLTYRQLCESFSQNHPHFAEKAIRYRKDGPRTLVVKLSSGRSIWYDDVDKTIRKLPDNPDEMNSMDILREFRKRVDKILIVRGMTRNDLASKTGIHPVQLSKYLNGKTVPSFIIVDKIARALDCPVDELRYYERKDN